MRPSLRAPRPSARKAGPGDAAAIARMAAESLPGRASDAWIVDPALGFVLGWRADDEAEILTLAVDEQSRGQGLGRALVTALLDEVRAAGARRVSLEVRSSNAAARALYASQGFTLTRARPRYYRDGEDALVLGLEL